ncbi:MAG: antibiotic biosynthesis monooxygenase [Thermoplasmata archaeon]
MAVARVAYWKFMQGQRERGKKLLDEMVDMFQYPGVLGSIWLDSTENPDSSLSFVIFESPEALEADAKDPRLREALKPMAAVVERLPPELHAYEVDFVRLRAGFGQRA